MNKDIQQILEAAITAPSGENTQPWKFEVRGLTIDVINHFERDESVYNWGQRASYIANGAVIENIVIASKEVGYRSEVSLFPNNSNEHLVARINLNKEQVEKDPLYLYIFQRVTNRKPYQTEAITSMELEELMSSNQNSCVEVHFTQEYQHKKALARIGSTNEEIMLSNEHLHKFFFNHINWDKKEDDEKKVGFFIDTLELAPPAKVSFKIIKHWRIMNLFNKLGFHKMVGKQNAQVNAAAAGFGVIVVPNLEPKNFVEAGRTLQRLWLTATKLNLSMQPLTGIIFFMYRVLANDTEKFSNSHVNIIKLAYNEMKAAFNIKGSETIAFMFRIGHGEKPTARSSRFPVNEVTTIIT